MGPSGSLVCQAILDQIMLIFHKLGVPLALCKLAGHASCIEFLGIEIDTTEGVPKLSCGASNGCSAVAPTARHVSRGS